MEIPYQQLHHIGGARTLQHARKQIIVLALTTSIRHAARSMGVSRNTVRLWLRRYLEDPTAPLTDRRPSTTNHPDRMEPEWEERLVTVVRQKIARNQRVIPTHIQHSLCCPYSLKTVNKILRRHDLYRTRHNRVKQKRNMQEVWKILKVWERIQVDIKYLCDIPELIRSLRHGYIPKYQITARDMATGALIFCYTNERSTTSTTLFIEYLFAHLQHYGVDLSQVTIQTDNGSEFTNWPRSLKLTLFEQAIEQYGATHRTIPVASPTHNSMVESSHRLIEDELYALMFIPSYRDFLAKARRYQSDFNFIRYNSYQKGSPYMRLVEKDPSMDPEVLELAPIEVEKLLTRERHTTWRGWHDGVP